MITSSHRKRPQVAGQQARRQAGQARGEEDEEAEGANRRQAAGGEGDGHHDGHRDQLGPRVEAVQRGVAGDVLAEGDVAEERHGSGGAGGFGAGSLPSLVKPSFHVVRKDLEVGEVPAEDLPNEVEIDIEVSVDKDVAEARYIPEARREFTGQHAHLCEAVNGRRVVCRIAAIRLCQMGRYVEGILGTELKSPLDQPAKICVIPELGGRCARVPAQVADGEPQCREVAPHGRVIRPSGRHRSPPEGELSRSIFARWGTKSQYRETA